jgi:hypothetical protein
MNSSQVMPDQAKKVDGNEYTQVAPESKRVAPAPTPKPQTAATDNIAPTKTPK